MTDKPKTVTIEVEMTEQRQGGFKYRQSGSDGDWQYDAPKFLNDTARKLLNPEPPEWLTELATKMIEKRYPSGIYAYNNTGYKKEWLNTARVAAKFAVEELGCHVHCDDCACSDCTPIVRRIKDLESVL